MDILKILIKAFIFMFIINMLSNNYSIFLESHPEIYLAILYSILIFLLNWFRRSSFLGMDSDMCEKRDLRNVLYVKGYFRTVKQNERHAVFSEIKGFFWCQISTLVQIGILIISAVYCEMKNIYIPEVQIYFSGIFILNLIELVAVSIFYYKNLLNF